MLNQILMTIGILCGLLGVAALLAPASKNSDISLLGGAALLSLGVILAAMSLKTWLNWRKYLKTNSIENAEPTSELEQKAATAPIAFRPKFVRRPQDRRRSQRILVQVAVLLRIQTTDDASRPTLAFTTWVNAHGGLLESPARIPAGQKITLIIPQSKTEASCHVLQVQKLNKDSFATTFKFDRPSPQFWPIASPPLDWDAAPALRW